MRSSPRIIRNGVLPLLALALGLAAPLAQAHGKKHVHGEMALDVAVDGPTLQLQLTAPLDTLVGFERRPRNDAERAAAAAALATLRNPAAWMTPDAAASCTPGELTLEPGPLEGEAKPGEQAGHADVELSVTWRCSQPAALKGVALKLFEAFPRTKRIEVQVAGGQGPAKQVLRKGNPVLRLGR